MATQWPSTLLQLLLVCVAVALPESDVSNDINLKVLQGETRQAVILREFTKLYNKHKGMNVSLVPVHPAAYDYFRLSGDTIRRRRRQACATDCTMPVIGDGPTAFGGLVSNNMYFEISSDACPVLSITCVGGGYAAIEVNTNFEEGSMLAGEFDDVSVVTATLTCEEYGWGATSQDLAPIGNAFTCEG
ncbi:unnamed protein product [Strongylus vulgaris]|uniref:C6 domain-containing protein n=1 Tax=Strongylus vulgaris TaxID=40348 RepID=A0A3P7JDB5_STRVU|nr:unnamed protein product [Strongylus vulgaris]